MQHTKDYLGSKLWKRGASVEADAMTTHEARVVRYYAWFWLFGQIAAIAALLFITVPVSLKYIAAAAVTLKANFPNKYAQSYSLYSHLTYR